MPSGRARDALGDYVNADGAQSPVPIYVLYWVGMGNAIRGGAQSSCRVFRLRLSQGTFLLDSASMTPSYAGLGLYFSSKSSGSSAPKKCRPTMGIGEAPERDAP